jgi:hypothetical protein
MNFSVQDQHTVHGTYYAGGRIMDSRILETCAVILLGTIKPELLKILDNAPAFGSVE